MKTRTASNISVKGIFLLLENNKPKIVHLASELYKWFTAMHSEGNPKTGSMIVEKAKFFNDCVKIAGKCHAASVRAVT